MEQEESSIGMTVSGIIGTSNPNDLPVTYKMQSWIMLCTDKCSHVTELKNREKRLDAHMCMYIYIYMYLDTNGTRRELFNSDNELQWLVPVLNGMCPIVE